MEGARTRRGAGVSVWTAENTVQVGRPCRILLDGREIQDVRKADDVIGYVVQLERDSRGQFCLIGDEVSTVMLFGKVEVVFSAP